MQLLKRGVLEYTLILVASRIGQQVAIDQQKHGIHMSLFADGDVVEYPQLPDIVEMEVDISSQFFLFAHVQNAIALDIGQVTQGKAVQIGPQVGEGAAGAVVHVRRQVGIVVAAAGLQSEDQHGYQQNAVEPFEGCFLERVIHGWFLLS